MSECIVLGAERVMIHASKTISKRKRQFPQTREKQGLGGTVVGRRPEEIQGAGPLHRNAQKRSRSKHGRDPQTAERGCRPDPEARLYLRFLPRTGVPADVPPQMEGVHSNDH